MSLTTAHFECFYELHESYVELVNMAISEGREDLAWELANQFDEEVLRAVHSRLGSQLGDPA
ncbi:MAG: hypothetical protein ABJA81_03365 [Nocardioidaceae bacterium]